MHVHVPRRTYGILERRPLSESRQSRTERLGSYSRHCTEDGLGHIERRLSALVEVPMELESNLRGLSRLLAHLGFERLNLRRQL